jgi:hypothetical protein
MLLYRVGTYLPPRGKSLNNFTNVNLLGGQAALGGEPIFLVLYPTQFGGLSSHDHRNADLQTPAGQAR